MEHGCSKGAGECHCTAMVRAAAAALKITLVKRTLHSQTGCDSKELRRVLLSFAFWRLCPKVTLRNIPEYVALYKTVVSFKSKLANSMASPTVASLIAEVAKRGISPPRGASKATLLNILASKESSPSRPTKTLDELRNLVREREQGRQLLAWSSEECRTFLLKRKRVSELRTLAVESGILTSASASKLAGAVLVERLATNRRMC